MRECLHTITRAAWVLLAPALLLATPLAVSAHVNRVVGPYTFFVVLIEEPYYEDNRAGFEFWVHDGSRQVTGLDHTLTAQASNTSDSVALEVSPLNNRGFYDVETSASGRPFDPGAGGDWVLRLTGTVEGLPVDVTFPVTFPTYPRIAVHASTASPAAAAASAGPRLVPFLGVVAGVVALAALGVRRRRSAGGQTETSPILPPRADIAQR